ncbi:ubiquitin carboxyl-terminal hydrolase 47 [Camelus ferus]|nr:ubiquitin carboxyl-terminal hydrolase 47 [Camelus ferus]
MSSTLQVVCKYIPLQRSADLINELYQGKLKDYVRCLECGYEGWRIDTYLDIPLVIRPYGSSQAFASVVCTFQLTAYGLRFLHFPYLLTLQLKRFDFDYTTMHRIKLNDRMTFPEELDMSTFIDVEDEKSPQTESCTDSGAENEGSCHSDQMSNDFSNDDGVDEGICLESNSGTEKTSKPGLEKSSLIYELFSIMVHSGSAAGGHYYACIKSFSDEQWYSFNDQHVSRMMDLEEAIHLPAETMRIVLERCYNDLRLLTVPNKTLKAEGFFRSNKVFVERSYSKRTAYQKAGGDSEESTEKLKSLSLQQQQEGDNGDSSKTSVDNRELEQHIHTSDPENFQSEERSDSDVNNDRNNAQIPLANGLDSHSITSSRRTKANEGKKETWDTAEEDSGTDSEYDESGKSRGELQYMYFKAEPYAADEGSGEGHKWLMVHVDKRITLAAFKQHLEPFVGVLSSHFKVFRVYASNQEFESVRLNETLSSFSDDNKPCKFLLDAVFAKGMTVRQSKEELIPQLREQCGLELSIDRFRLRKKTWKNPGTVFLDYHIYEEDINISSNWEVFLEVLDGVEKMKSMSQLAVLSRRWRPSQMKLDPFQEIVLESSSVDELREKLCEISGIPLEDIEFAKGRGTFPCDISVLDIHQDLDWNPKVSTLNVWPLYICDDGAVIFYRDKTEELMELTDEQRNELMKKESSRLQKTGHRVTYSPRKEKALKIYLDGAPNKDLTQD